MSDTQKTTFILGAGLFLLPIAFNLDAGSTLPVKRTVLYAVAALLGLVWLRHRESRPPCRVTGLLPGCIYVLVGGCSVLWSVNPFSAFVESLQAFAVLFIIITCLPDLGAPHFHRLTRFAAASGLVVAVAGICQYHGLGFLWIPSAGLPSATFSFRNLTASYLIGSIPLAIIAWHTDSHRIRRAMWLLSASTMFILLVYTRTRGAWAGLLAGAAVSAFYLFRSGYRFPAISIREGAAIGLVVLTIGYACSLGAYQSSDAPQKFDDVKSSAATALISMVDAGADRGRRIFWNKTFEMIAANPVLGVGLDNWEYHYPIYDRGEWNRGFAEPVRPHNDLLWIWSELGIVGLAGFLGVILTAIVGTVRKSADPRYDAISAGCLASLVALFGHSQFSFLREQPAAALLMCVSLLGLALPWREPMAVISRRTVGLGVLAFGLVALTVAIAHVRFESHFQRATGAYNSGDFAATERLSNRAASYGIFDHRVLFLKGKAQQSLGRHSDAAATYEQALAYHPYYANTHHNLGGVLAAQGNTKGAIASYRRSLEIRPTNTEARVNLANALIADNQVGAAKKEMAQAIASGTRLPAAYGMMGAIALYQNQPSEAIGYLEHAVKIAPDYVEAHNNLALAYEQSDQPAAAADAYRNVLRLWQGDPEYRTSILARIRQLTEDRE